MRTTDTITISLPKALARQMEKVQKEESRTRSELLREAWRRYFDSRYPVYAPTKAEKAAIARGRAEIRAGDFITLEELHAKLDAKNRQKSGKSARKTAR